VPRVTLSRLVKKSLVLADHSRDETRFGLLETIREYALGMLRDSGEEHHLRQRHLNWVAAMAGQADELLWTSEQRSWLERLDARAMALETSFYFAHLTGDLTAAQTYSEAACLMAREVDDPPALICSLLSQAIVSGTAGDLAGCQSSLDEALFLARDAHWEPGVRMALLDLGVVARMRGDVDRAAARFDEGRALSEAAGDSYTQGFYLTNLAHLAIQQGDDIAAAAWYRHALAIWRDLQDTHNLAMALEGLAWAVGAQGRAEEAARLLGAAEPLRELVGTALLPHWRADHDRARAAAQAALGKRAFAAALARGRAMTVEQAIAFGLATHDDRRSSGRRSAGPRSGAARPALSPREAQVAQLVARGLTNRQIAGALVLQESTVGNHLQRIYARLGLSGRAQLAAWLAEHDDPLGARSS